MASALEAEIRRRVARLGYELVDVRKRGTGSHVRLQLRVDVPDASPGHGITIEQCAAVSRELESWLDAEEPLGVRYVLEVSSPGIERPIRWRDHWVRYVGHDVSVKLAGRGRIRASIVGVLEDERVGLRPAGSQEEVIVPLEEACDATLYVDWSAIERATAEQK